MQKYQSTLLKITALIVIVGIAFYFSKVAQSNESVQDIVLNYGYLGIFLVSIISGFNLIVPIPVISFLPLFLESGLSFWITIFIISFGLSIGDALGYVVGRVGREVASTRSKKILEKLEKIKAKSHNTPLVILFFYAFLVPLPNELIVIPLSFAGYKLKTIFPIVFIGNILFNILFGQTIVTVFGFL